MKFILIAFFVLFFPILIIFGTRIDSQKGEEGEKCVRACEYSRYRVIDSKCYCASSFGWVHPKFRKLNIKPLKKKQHGT